jgi:hypothetical protein
MLRFSELAATLEPSDKAQVELVRDSFAAQAGLRAGSRWRPLDASEAADLLAGLLAFDLAYDCERVESPLPVARSLAAEFLALFGPTPGLFTNADLTRRLLPHRPVRGRHFVAHDWVQPERHELPRPSAWDPLTQATFDCGVLAISRQRVGCLWVEDED